MDRRQRFKVRVGDREHDVVVNDGGRVEVDGEVWLVNGNPQEDWRVQHVAAPPFAPPMRVHVVASRDPDLYYAATEGDVATVEVYTAARAELAEALAQSQATYATAGRVKAPMPGRVVRSLVALGDHVEAGQTLVILEAMKMENEVQSPAPGVVVAVDVVAGQAVDAGQVLIELSPHSTD